MPGQEISTIPSSRMNPPRVVGRERSRPIRWLIVEDALLNRKGHWFEAVSTFSRGFRARGDHVTVLADAAVDPDIRDALTAVAVLPHSIWHRAGDGSGPVKRYARVLVHPWQTRRVLNRFFSAHRDDDAILVPSVGFHHLLAWYWLLKTTLRKRSVRVLLFFLMLPIRWDSQTQRALPDGSPTSRLFFRLLKSLESEIQSGKVVLGAEVEPLRAALEQLAGVRATLFPQIVVPLRSAGQASRAADSPIQMGAYGPPRAEKGSDILQQAISIYLRRFPDGQARFTIHWTEDFAAESGAVISRSPELMQDGRVEYVTRFLSHQEYEEQLCRTQVMLLPYRLSGYRLRGSRVVIESLVNGIPVIATRGTALAEVVRSFGTGVFCEDGDPESLALAIRECEIRYAEMRRLAELNTPIAVNEFSVEAFRRVFLAAGSGLSANSSVRRAETISA